MVSSRRRDVLRNSSPCACKGMPHIKPQLSLPQSTMCLCSPAAPSAWRIWPLIELRSWGDLLVTVPVPICGLQMSPYWVELCSQKIRTHPHPPELGNGTLELIWKKGLCGGNGSEDLEMRSSWMAQGAPKSSDCCP